MDRDKKSKPCDNGNDQKQEKRMIDSRLKLLIFDMDGVILDSEPLHENARQMMFRRLGIVPDDTFPDPVGNSSSGFWKQVIEKCGIEGEPVDLEKEQYRLVAQQIEEDQIPPSEGLKELLLWAIGNGIKIGLASSSTRVLVDDALRLLKIERYFDHTVSGDEVSAKKPAPDVYYRVLEMAGIPAEYAAAVEDTHTGMLAAKNAGIFCYGYRNMTSGAQDMSAADRIIDKLEEIMYTGGRIA